MSGLSKWVRKQLGIQKRSSTAFFPKTWEERIALALMSADNAHIPRVPGAGTITDGWLTMHNGLLVSTDSYYDPGAMELMRQNRGVHEPQEERAFQLVLPRLRPDAVMVELGAYWCFYSMWFAREVGPDARCVCIEAMQENLDAGVRNAAKNGLSTQMAFEHAFADAQDSIRPDGVRRVSVPGLMRAHGLDRVDILHADVQGAEVDVLLGAAEMLTARAIACLFVSTHGTRLHERCRRMLRSHRYTIGIDVTPMQSFAYDGLIVATAPGVEPLRIPDLSKRAWKPEGPSLTPVPGPAGS